MLHSEKSPVALRSMRLTLLLFKVYLSNTPITESDWFFEYTLSADEKARRFIDKLCDGIIFKDKASVATPQREYDAAAKELIRVGQDANTCPNDCLSELDFCPNCGDFLQPGHECDPSWGFDSQELPTEEEFYASMHNGPEEEDGPWADGWEGRIGHPFGPRTKEEQDEFDSYPF